MGPFVGQNWGGKYFERVQQALQYSYRFCLGWAFLVAVVLKIEGQTFASLFNPSLKVVDVAAYYFTLVPISYGAVGIILVSCSAFNAMGKPLIAISLSIFQLFVLYIPIAHIGNYFIGLTGVFTAASASNIAIGFIAYFWSKKICLQSSNIRSTLAHIELKQHTLR